jgi:beta-1,4-N-acetylglucosaminyltransferase
VARTEPRESGRADASANVLLVCSSGGHLLQLHALRRAWEETSRVWVTFDKSDARSLLSGEEVVHAFGPTNRNIPNLLRNVTLAWRVIRRVRPAVLVTTGAGVAVPFAWIGRLHGARIVYVESLTRIESPSLSCRLIRPIADRVYVQWPELQQALRRSRYVGAIFSWQ